MMSDHVSEQINPRINLMEKEHEGKRVTLIAELLSLGLKECDVATALRVSPRTVSIDIENNDLQEYREIDLYEGTPGFQRSFIHYAKLHVNGGIEKIENRLLAEALESYFGFRALVWYLRGLDQTLQRLASYHFNRPDDGHLSLLSDIVTLPRERESSSYQSAWQRYLTKVDSTKVSPDTFDGIAAELFEELYHNYDGLFLLQISTDKIKHHINAALSQFSGQRHEVLIRYCGIGRSKQGVDKICYDLNLKANEFDKIYQQALDQLRASIHGRLFSMILSPANGLIEKVSQLLSQNDDLHKVVERLNHELTKTLESLQETKKKVHVEMELRKGSREIPPAILLLPLDQLFFNSKEQTQDKLALRTFTCLSGAGYGCVGEIVQLTRDDLLAITGFGPKSLSKVEEKLTLLDKGDQYQLRVGMKLTKAQAKEVQNKKPRS